MKSFALGLASKKKWNWGNSEIAYSSVVETLQETGWLKEDSTFLLRCFQIKYHPYSNVSVPFTFDNSARRKPYGKWFRTQKQRGFIELFPLRTSSRIIFLTFVGLTALKCICSANSDLGSIMPCSVVTEKSSPRLSIPLTLQATASNVLLRRNIVFVSFLEITNEKQQNELTKTKYEWKSDPRRKNTQKEFWGFNGIRTHDLRDTSAMLHQLSYKALLEAGQERVQFIPFIWTQWDMYMTHTICIYCG